MANKDVHIDDKEFTIAEKAAQKEGSPVYTHTFIKPFEWGGKTYETLEFDFAKLTGKDALAIENELALQGKAVVVASMSSEFLIRMAARASGLGADAFEAMSISDFNRIRSRARSFLLRSEL